MESNFEKKPNNASDHARDKVTAAHLVAADDYDFDIAYMGTDETEGVVTVNSPGTPESITIPARSTVVISSTTHFRVSSTAARANFSTGKGQFRTFASVTNKSQEPRNILVDVAVLDAGAQVAWLVQKVFI